MEPTTAGPRSDKMSPNRLADHHVEQSGDGEMRGKDVNVIDRCECWMFTASGSIHLKRHGVMPVDLVAEVKCLRRHARFKRESQHAIDATARE